MWVSKSEKVISLGVWRVDDVIADPRLTSVRCVWGQTEAGVDYLPDGWLRAVSNAIKWSSQ